MAKKYAAIAFTNEVKKMQEKWGSRGAYARMENHPYVDGLTENERAFIGMQDSFYLATTGDNGYPYIQHRGGPKGFVKVLDANRVGFIDFSGNKQFISVGNLATHSKVAIIMVDYPSRTRLKLYARAIIADLEEDRDLYQQLDLQEYQFQPERMIVFHIEAYDWNCPQHITRRYTLEQIEGLFNDQNKHIKDLETEIKILKARVKAQVPDGK